MPVVSGMTQYNQGEEFWLKPNHITLKNGAQVTFRLEEKTDLELIWKMFSTLSNDSLQFLPIPITRERVEKWIEELDHEKALVILGVIEEGKTKIIANSSLDFNDMDYNRHKANFGITVHDDYQNMGLGSILTGYMIDIAKVKGIMRIELEVVANNSRAIRVYENNGFVKEGRLRKNHWNHVLGKYCDDIVMGLLLNYNNSKS